MHHPISIRDFFVNTHSRSFFFVSHVDFLVMFFYLPLFYSSKHVSLDNFCKHNNFSSVLLLFGVNIYDGFLTILFLKLTDKLVDENCCFQVECLHLDGILNK